jgi:hypothetical protein
MTQRFVERADNRGTALEHDTDPHRSDLDRLRAENGQLRELIAYLTHLLVRHVVDRR